MDRHLIIAFIISASASPAFGECRLCAPTTAGQANAPSIPLSIGIEAGLDLGRAAQTHANGAGTITIDPQTGVRRVSGTLTDLGGLSFKGAVRLTGQPFAPVMVSMPGRISLTTVDGSTADVIDIQTDLRPGAMLDSQGKLNVAFGGRLIVTSGQAGEFRGRIPVVAEYR